MHRLFRLSKVIPSALHSHAAFKGADEGLTVAETLVVQWVAVAAFRINETGVCATGKRLSVTERCPGDDGESKEGKATHVDLCGTYGAERLQDAGSRDRGGDEYSP